MPLTVHSDGAAPVIVDNRFVFNRLPPETDVFELLSSILKGDPVPVIFRDGTAVTLTSPNAAPMLLESPMHQRSLALPAPDPTRAFEIECQILVAVDATVSCHALNKHMAERMIDEVFAGLRAQDKDFSVLVQRDELANHFHRIEQACRKGIAAEIGAFNVMVNRVEER